MIDRKFILPQSQVTKFNTATALRRVRRDIQDRDIALRTQNIVTRVNQVDKVVPLPRASLVLFK